MVLKHDTVEKKMYNKDNNEYLIAASRNDDGNAVTPIHGRCA